MLSAKSIAINLLERHPYGHALGVLLLDHVDAMLPHEAEYWGFATLARAYNFTPKVILDIGANRGHSARAFMKILSGWQVVSFEASPMHEPRLAAIKERHPDRFSYRIGAITDGAKGNLDLFTPVYRGMAMHSCSALSYKEALKGAETGFPAKQGAFKIVKLSTPTLSIDMLGLDVSFIKLDIQGEELNALKGMRSLLKRCRPVLLVETNFLEMDSPSALSPLIAFLTELDYQPWSFNAKKRTFKAEWVDAKAHRNRFFAHKSLAIPEPR